MPSLVCASATLANSSASGRLKVMSDGNLMRSRKPRKPRWIGPVLFLALLAFCLLILLVLVVRALYVAVQPGFFSPDLRR